MKSTLAILAVAAVAAVAPAQTVTFANVGAPAAVPDPNGGTPGTLSLSAYSCALSSGRSLVFELTGLPTGYQGNPPSPTASEVIAFIIDVGPASLPGTSMGGATFFLPLTTPVILNPPTPAPLAPSSVYYIGPGDIVCPNGTFGGIGGNNRIGAKLDITTSYGPGLGTFSMQGALLDPNTGALFTSNAVNFTM
ncbi:MAG TPA: hypothetical protein VEI02_08855 [Planctomycetota bacterium]|nr:hypothetical protein [Planctomycetota bacterium]